jgi:signal transduction histidine kinase
MKKHFIAVTLLTINGIITSSFAQPDTVKQPVPTLMPPSAMAGLSPMPMPGMTGPLKANPRLFGYKTGFLGTMYITGVASGFAQWQTSPSAEDHDLFKYLLTEKNNIPFKIVVENKENYFIRETIDIASDDGTPTGYVIVVKNVTSFKELDVAKTNFIATISHELKTPLASSDFSLKLLEDERVGVLNNEQKELVQNIKNDNQRLLRILSELLDLSQVESGKIRLNLQSASPGILIQKAIESTANAAKSKHINVHINLATEKNVIADEDKTTWVLNNFISNAIKHSSENSNIVIDVKENNLHISFHVKDEGIGIDKKHLPRVFDRFFKVPGQKGGTGLGLAISKEFIEAMDGKIYATSETGKGSTFSFDLKKA